jgi:glycopeptide antibiotics resistance protein
MIIKFHYLLFLIIPLWTLSRILINKKSIKFSLYYELTLNFFFFYILFVLSIINLFPLIIGLPNYYTYPLQNNFIPLKGLIEQLRSTHHILLVLKTIIGNVLLMVPFGFMLPFVLRRYNTTLKVITIGFIFSLGIEFLQFLAPHRVVNADNFLYHTLGVTIGYFIYKICSLKLSTQPENLYP